MLIEDEKLQRLMLAKNYFQIRDKSDPIFFCQIIPSDEETSPTIPAKNATMVRPSIKSEIIIINAPLNPKIIPSH